MKRSYSGHIPVRVPAGWTEQSRSMVIQINGLFDDLYRKINELQNRVELLEKEDEDNGGTDNEPASAET